MSWSFILYLNSFFLLDIRIARWLSLLYLAKLLYSPSYFESLSFPIEDTLVLKHVVSLLAEYCRIFRTWVPLYLKEDILGKEEVTNSNSVRYHFLSFLFRCACRPFLAMLFLFLTAWIELFSQLSDFFSYIDQFNPLLWFIWFKIFPLFLPF